MTWVREIDRQVEVLNQMVIPGSLRRWPMSQDLQIWKLTMWVSGGRGGRGWFTPSRENHKGKSLRTWGCFGAEQRGWAAGAGLVKEKAITKIREVLARGLGRQTGEGFGSHCKNFGFTMSWKVSHWRVLRRWMVSTSGGCGTFRH